MWISKKEVERLIETARREAIDYDHRSTKEINELTVKYDRLLKYLELYEWTEPATPEKTVLITDKEREKRVKQNKKSYVDPRISQQQTFANALSNMNHGSPLGGTSWSQQTTEFFK